MLAAYNVWEKTVHLIEKTRLSDRHRAARLPANVILAPNTRPRECCDR